MRGYGVGLVGCATAAGSWGGSEGSGGCPRLRSASPYTRHPLGIPIAVVFS